MFVAIGKIIEWIAEWGVLALIVIYWIILTYPFVWPVWLFLLFSIPIWLSYW